MKKLLYILGFLILLSLAYYAYHKAPKAPKPVQPLPYHVAPVPKPYFPVIENPQGKG